ncbi:MAG TPA: hypothetical protein PLW89_09740, partial [Limnochordia bacterium]|nr:hypothetical protein [Limnochordia bacterium]
AREKAGFLLADRCLPYPRTACSAVYLALLQLLAQQAGFANSRAKTLYMERKILAYIMCFECGG